MSLLLPKYSKFYYNYVIDTDNKYLDFSEGGPEITAELQPGDYSFTDFAAEIARALNDIGGLTYIVTANRSTRTITISAGSNFSLLVATGTHSGSTVFTLAGFTGADRTSAMTYTANNTSGDEFVPQFLLQSYVSSDDWQQAADASVNKTAAGQIEIIKFGTEKFFQWSFNFATNIPQPCGGPIRNNATGLQDLRAFMQYAITRSPLEFMPDKDLPSTFYKIILETTPESNTGVGYRLKEHYDKNLPGYFETGTLKWRLIE